MTDNNKGIKYLPDAGLFVAVMLFFGILYGGHLAFQEQYQLFEWTSGYFASVVASPGGFADWCGRLLTQFFVFPWIGAALIALCLVLVRWLCFISFGRESRLGCVLGYLPPVLLIGYLLDSAALMGGVAAVMLSLAAALAVRAISCGKLRTMLVLVLSPVMYFAVGPLGILFPIMASRGESCVVRIAAALLFVASPFVASLWCHYPLKDLLAGVHYYRLPHNIVWTLWIPAVLIVVADSYVPKLRFKKSLNETVAVIVTSLVIVAVAVLAAVEKADWEGEELMTYDRLVVLEDWDGVEALALRKAPDKPFSVCCLNLALARQGQLGDKMFAYVQSGEKGLFPSYSISYTSLLPTSEVYRHLHLVNACQQYVFESPA